MMTAQEIITYMESLRNEEQRKILMGFFKTGPGEYGEGDEFLGLKVPQTREIVKSVCKDLESVSSDTMNGADEIYNGTEQQKKAAATYAKHHGAKDNRFKRIAREQTAKYGKMVDVFATETYEKLKSQAYGIGSDVVERMIEDGWSPEDAEEFLKQVMETMNDIPAEARNLADQDTFWMNIKDISEVLHDNVNSDSFRDVLTAYMTADNRDDFMDVLNNYVELGEDIPFGEIWEGLQYYDDIASPDNMQEVIDELRGE